MLTASINSASRGQSCERTSWSMPLARGKMVVPVRILHFDKVHETFEYPENKALEVRRGQHIDLNKRGC